MMDDGEILKVLQRAVMAAIKASPKITGEFPVKYIGRSWEIPDDQKWFELVFLPNNRNDHWGNEQNYMGVMRLILHWPNDDKGAYEPLAILRSVVGYFTKGLFLQSVRIYETPSLTGVLEQGNETLYPASIRYQSFRQE